MSLINDALKRARESSQPKNPPAGPSPSPALLVQKKRRNQKWILPATILFLIVAAFFLIALAFTHHSVKRMAAVPEISTTQEVETVSVPIQELPPMPVIGAAAITNNLPPPPQVQGIVYDPVHPWAIVSGRTIYIGDLVDGKRVAAISRDAIILVGKGKTNRLILGQ